MCVRCFRLQAELSRVVASSFVSNDVGPEGIRYLADALRENRSLKEVE